jgi:hypothetical protein
MRQILSFGSVVLWNAPQAYGWLSFNFWTKPDLFIFQANDGFDLATKIALRRLDLPSSLALLQLSFLVNCSRHGKVMKAVLNLIPQLKSDWSTSGYKYLSHCVRVP